jgi:hypothetical protein
MLNKIRSPQARVRVVGQHLPVHRDGLLLEKPDLRHVQHAARPLLALVGHLVMVARLLAEQLREPHVQLGQVLRAARPRDRLTRLLDRAAHLRDPQPQLLDVGRIADQLLGRRAGPQQQRQQHRGAQP